MADAVIFEADGALVDSLDLQVGAWLEALAYFGKRRSGREVHALLGSAGDELLGEILSDAEMRRLGEQLEAWRLDFYERNQLPRVLPLPRVRALFHALGERGVRRAIVSDAPRRVLDREVALCNLNGAFEVGVAREDVGRNRPHSALLSSALERLGVPAAGAALVSATPNGVSSAQRLGLRAIGLTAGGFSAEALGEAGASAVYESPAALLDHLEDSPLRGGLADVR